MDEGGCRVQRRAPSPSCRLLLQLQVMQDDFHSLFFAQVASQLLRQKYRAMLPAGTSKRNRQALESAALVVGDTRFDQRHYVLEVLVHALLLIEVVNHGRIFAGEGLEPLFSPRIGEAADVEDESTAMAGLVFRRTTAMEGKTEDAYNEFFSPDRGFGGRNSRRGTAGARSRKGQKFL